MDSTMLYGSFNKEKQQKVVQDKDSIDYMLTNNQQFETFGELEGKSKVTAVSELQSPDRTPSGIQKMKQSNITTKHSAKKDDLTNQDFDPYQNKSV